MKHLVVKPEKCIGCRTCELVCSFGHYKQFNPRMANVSVLAFEAEKVQVPVVCQHCENASCVAVCPVHAITRSAEGVVTIDYDKCIGCKLCKNACPMGNISYSSRIQKVFKCDLCGGDPKCAQFCPGGAITVEDADAVDSRKKETAAKLAAAAVAGKEA